MQTEECSRSAINIALFAEDSSKERETVRTKLENRIYGLNQNQSFCTDSTLCIVILLTPTTDLVPGMRASNAYLRKAESGELILIDSGMPGNAKKIAEYISTKSLDPKTLSLLLLTHADIDHSGSIWELKHIFSPDARVAIQAEDAPRVAGEKKLKDVKGAMGLIMRVVGPLMRFRTFQPDIVLKDNDVIADLRTIYTPGHTQGSVCFYNEKEKVLFSGDTLLTDGNGNATFAGKSISYDLELTKRSVASKIKDLDYEILLPGHGPPITSHASVKVRELLSSG